MSFRLAASTVESYAFTQVTLYVMLGDLNVAKPRSKVSMKDSTAERDVTLVVVKFFG